MNISCVFNSAPHYRLPIYKLLEKEFACDFYFSKDPVGAQTIKQISCEELNRMHYLDCRSYFGGKIFIQKHVLPKTKHSELIILGGDINSISTWLLLIRGIFLKQKIFLWTHGWYGKESRIKSIIKKLFFHLADGLLLYGDYAFNLLKEQGFREDKLYKIYNSLDYDKQLCYRDGRLKSDRIRKHFKNNLPTVVFIGRLTKVKNLNLLLKAQAISRKFNILLIGDGEERFILKKFACDKNITDYIWFYGSCYKEDELGSLIYNSDVCVSPGNVGLTALHSFAFGTPVITHSDFRYQMPEFEIIEDGKTGTFFIKDDLQSLISKIEEWLKKCKERENIRKYCYEALDTHWNPHYQLKIIKNICAKYGKN